jgi:hypothetical protein
MMGIASLDPSYALISEAGKELLKVADTWLVFGHLAPA